MIDNKKKFSFIWHSIIACKSDGPDEIQLTADVTSKYSIENQKKVTSNRDIKSKYTLTFLLQTAVI